MKVYIVTWADYFGDWKIKRVFSSEEKAKGYIEGKSDSYNYIVKDLE